MTKYTTIQGDTWDSISFKLYGNEKYMRDLIEANKSYIDIIIFPPNIELVVPKISKTSSSSLPWQVLYE